jgi:hypothetical protein
MEFFTSINIKPLQPPVTYKENILLIGSCFTEHIGKFLGEVKFNVLQNPNGILFDPLSVCNSLISYVRDRRYDEEDLFYFNESWHSWQHHSRFSHPDKQQCLDVINASQKDAHAFLQKADWVIITLGSSFVYKLTAEAPAALQKGNRPEVANCHKVPSPSFSKHLCTIEEIITALDGTIHQLFHFNPRLRFIFTISPVRHLRDGVVENNRSKARLIEAVHHMVNKFERLYYFPAYELVIDVLRDYRFYDIDLAHPNYAATQFVIDKFAEACFDPETRSLSEEIKSVVTARRHTPFNPSSGQHRQFLATYLEKTMALQERYPYLDFTRELEYFRKGEGK